jgi:SAM-dependent methyltransferase
MEPSSPAAAEPSPTTSTDAAPPTPAAHKAHEDDRITEDIYEYRLPDHWILDPKNLWSVMHGRRVQAVVDQVVASGARTVLEVGCGDGYNCGRLADAGLDVAGVDWSRNGIAHAKRLVPKGRFFCGDIRDEEFKRAFPEPFDVVLLIEVLEHIPPADCAPALRSMADCLKPGGLFVITTPSVNLRQIPSMHYRHFDEPTLRGVVRDAGGFSIEKLTGYGDIPAEHAYYRWVRLIDNPVFTIHPLRDAWQAYYARRCSGTPPHRCHGWIMTLRKNPVQVQTFLGAGGGGGGGAGRPSAKTVGSARD